MIFLIKGKNGLYWDGITYSAYNPYCFPLYFSSSESAIDFMSDMPNWAVNEAETITQVSLQFNDLPYSCLY